MVRMIGTQSSRDSALLKGAVCCTKLPWSRRGEAVIGILLPNNGADPLLDTFPLNGSVRRQVGYRACPAWVVGWIQLHRLVRVPVAQRDILPTTYTD